MNIKDFVEVAGVEIVVKYVGKSGYQPWIANLKKPFFEVFFKDTATSATATYPHGGGVTPDAAVRDFVTKLNASKYAVMVAHPGENAQGSDRQTFIVPQELTYET